MKDLNIVFLAIKQYCLEHEVIRPDWFEALAAELDMDLNGFHISVDILRNMKLVLFTTEGHKSIALTPLGHSISRIASSV